MPRVEVKSIGGLKSSSAITKTFRAAADRLYDAYLLDPTPDKRFGLFDRAYTKFVRETEHEFEKMAAKIHRRWNLPEAVEPLDCLQDLHAEIVRILKNYDPEQATVAAFMVWNAFSRAKKECNRQRGKVNSREKSRHALPISRLSLPKENGKWETADDTFDRLITEGACPSQFVRSSDEKLDFDRVMGLLSNTDKSLVCEFLANTATYREKGKSDAIKRALRRFLTIRSMLECEGYEYGQPIPESEEPKPKSERRPVRKNRVKSSEPTQPEGQPVEEAIRLCRSESSPDDVAAAWAAARRKSRRENETTLVLLCA